MIMDIEQNQHIIASEQYCGLPLRYPEYGEGDLEGSHRPASPTTPRRLS